MNERIYNVNPGPAILPEDVLKEAQRELLNFHGTGMSILEISHRDPDYDAVHQQVKTDIKELMSLGDDYEVVFTAGGASQSFALIPLNFASAEHPGTYALSGSFSEKAYEEAVRLGVGTVAASTKEGGYVRVPTQEEMRIDPNAAYLHICLNNTIYGTEYHNTPKTNGVPLFADMSSDILSRPWDFSSYDFIYAGVQKNLGPAGVVLNVAKKKLLESSPAELPTMLRYSTFQKNDSLYNTPPVFAIYRPPLRCHRRIGRILSRARREGQPLPHERYLPPPERKSRKGFRRRGKGTGTCRYQGTPQRRRHARLHLQRYAPRRRRKTRSIYGRVP